MTYELILKNNGYYLKISAPFLNAPDYRFLGNSPSIASIEFNNYRKQMKSGGYKTPTWTTLFKKVAKENPSNKNRKSAKRKTSRVMKKNPPRSNSEKWATVFFSSTGVTKAISHPTGKLPSVVADTVKRLKSERRFSTARIYNLNDKLIADVFKDGRTIMHK